jgi:hypothetical protein
MVITYEVVNDLQLFIICVSVLFIMRYVKGRT